MRCDFFCGHRNRFTKKKTRATIQVTHGKIQRSTKRGWPIIGQSMVILLFHHTHTQHSIEEGNKSEKKVLAQQQQQIQICTNKYFNQIKE